MKTLVIHPYDPSTDFLAEIYKGKDWTVMTGPFHKATVARMIKTHDRVIMLGHGTPNGLIGNGGFVIDYKTAALLRNKKECVFIWCHADDYVKLHELSGFFTGMIISEMSEAQSNRVKCIAADVVESNALFAAAVAEGIDLPQQELLNTVKTLYWSNTNPVIQYNAERVFAGKCSWGFPRAIVFGHPVRAKSEYAMEVQVQEQVEDFPMDLFN